MKMIYQLFFVLAASLSLSAFAQALSTGEGAYLANGDPAMGGQATNDHLFVRGSYDDIGEITTYDNVISFKSGDTQLVWFYLDDDEIYLNEAVQALPPIPFNAAGELYNEITYNSFQFEVYLPESIDIVFIEDEESGEEIHYVQGDRLPTIAALLIRGPEMKENSPSEIAYKVIDGKNYKVYRIISYNANAYGSHLSAKNGALYKRNGALKKDATLFGLYLKNNNQETVDGQIEDVILGNLILGVRETTIAGWDSNQSAFFYGEGGNDESQRFMKYNRVNTYGSAGISSEMTDNPQITYRTSDNDVVITATGKGEVKLYINDQQVNNPYTIPRGMNDVTVTAKATAQEVGKAMSSITMSILVPAKNYNTDNRFSLVDLEAMHGDTVVIPVSMSNEDEITAFQTDVYLPEGFEMVKEDGEYLIELSDRKSRTHVIMANDAPEGFVRILSYSSGLKPFTGNDGELFYITVKVPDDGDGVYPVELRNTRLTTTDGDELSIADASCNVTVYPYILGDVNNSGAVTITDVVVTARYILFYNPIPFVFGAADVNADGQITVTDAVRIAYMVLGGNTLHAPSRAPVLTSDWMSGMCQLSPDGTGTVSINLDNSTDYTAVQFDLALPDGVSAGNFRLTDRAGNHMLGTGTSEEGSVRVLCYSPSLLPIDGHDGALLTFDVTATGEDVGDISATGIELVSTSGQTMMINPFSISLSRSTGVVESSACKTVRRVDYYNLAGQRIANPENGVSVVVTTYSDGSRSTAKVIK